MIEEKIQQFFISKHLTLSLAESCTGGGIAARLVQIPGASKYFLGSLVTYATSAKSRLLGVAPSLLKEVGSVHENIAREMAKGARRQFGSDYALSVTGVAGPEPSQVAVGTVCFAIVGPFESTWTSHFSGSRSEVIEQAIEEALRQLVNIPHFFQR